MNRNISRFYFGGAIIVAVLFLLANLSPLRSAWGEEPKSTAASDVTLNAPAGQVYELRIYTAAPGKLPALNQRFRDHTLRLFAKHGIKSVGYWTAEDEHEQQRLYYLIAYPDRESRDKMLIQGIAVDPEFHQVVAESEKAGKLTTKVESVILMPTDYSPLK